MAAINLRTLELADVADPSDFMSFPMMSALRVVPAEVGEVRQMANGRLRSVSKVGRTTTVETDLPNCTRDQVLWLADHIGRMVRARDDRGNKVVGIYWSVPQDEHQYDDETDVALTLTEVTHSEYA